MINRHAFLTAIAATLAFVGVPHSTIARLIPFPARSRLFDDDIERIIDKMIHGKGRDQTVLNEVISETLSLCRSETAPRPPQVFCLYDVIDDIPPPRKPALAQFVDYGGAFPVNPIEGIKQLRVISGTEAAAVSDPDSGYRLVDRASMLPLNQMEIAEAFYNDATGDAVVRLVPMETP